MICIIVGENKNNNQNIQQSLQKEDKFQFLYLIDV
jgi:hypothetical protein